MNRSVTLLLLFFACAVRFLIVIPPFEGPDEPTHFGYVTQLRQTGRLPDPLQSAQNLAAHESGQAPLQYLVVWAWSLAGQDYQWNGSPLPPNPWIWNNTPSWMPDNRNRYLLGAGHIPYDAQPNSEAALLWQRFVSVFEGLLAVALIYAAAKRLLTPGWARVAVVLFAFNPMVIQSFGVLGNDAAAILMGALSTLVLVQLAQRPMTRHLLLISGGLLGVAALSKASVLIFIPIAAGMVIWRTRKRNTLTHLGWLIVPVLLIGAPWYGWNAIQYGDPFGMKPHLAMAWAFNPPRSLAAALADDQGSLFLSTWGALGGMARIAPRAWVYAVPLLLTAVGIIGLIRGYRVLRSRWRIMAALLAVCAALLVAVLRWLQSFSSVTGRLLLPGYGAFVLLITLGMAFGWRKTRQMIAITGGGLTVFIAVVVGWVTLTTAYGVVLHPLDQLPPLDGTPRRFGEVELLGYHIDQDALVPNTPLDVTLCWRSLREDRPLAVPYPFFFVIGEGASVVGRRDSYTGMGTYTYWQPGSAFCDRFQVPVDSSVQPSRVYTISVGLFDRATSRPLAESNGSSRVVGSLAAHGAPLSSAERNQAHFNFGGAYLLDYQIVDQGTTLEVTTAWGTGDWQPHPLLMFAQVLNEANAPIILATFPVGHSTYPAEYWGANEQTFTQTDTLLLPQPLPPGRYRVVISLYNAASTVTNLNVLYAQSPIPVQSQDGTTRTQIQLGTFAR